MNKIVTVPAPSALSGLTAGRGAHVHKIPTQMKVRVQMWKTGQRSSNGRVGWGEELTHGNSRARLTPRRASWPRSVSQGGRLRALGFHDSRFL